MLYMFFLIKYLIKNSIFNFSNVGFFFKVFRSVLLYFFLGFYFYVTANFAVCGFVILTDLCGIRVRRGGVLVDEL